MRKANVIIICFALGTASAAMAEINDGLGVFVKPKPAAPAATQPAMQAPAMAPAKAAAAPGEGEVVSKVDGAGYTYLELKHQGKTFWIAGTQVNAKKGDKIRFEENVVMENFFSKTLNRSFDRIIFASAVKIVK
jgi:hypothetical protein